MIMAQPKIAQDLLLKYLDQGNPPDTGFQDPNAPPPTPAVGGVGAGSGRRTGGAAAAGAGPDNLPPVPSTPGQPIPTATTNEVTAPPAHPGAAKVGTLGPGANWQGALAGPMYTQPAALPPSSDPYTYGPWQYPTPPGWGGPLSPGPVEQPPVLGPKDETPPGAPPGGGTGPIEPVSKPPTEPGVPEPGPVGTPPDKPAPAPTAPTGPTTNTLVTPPVRPTTPTPTPTPTTPAPAPAPAPEAPVAPAAPAGPTNWATVDFSQPGMVENWFRERGVTPAPTSPDYWRQKWNEWGRNDPAFFLQRLSRAEEIVGAPGSPGNPTSAPSAPAPTNTYQDNIHVANPTDPRIMDAIMKMLAQGSAPVTADDPSIRAQFNPQSQIIQRNNARARAGASERAFAQGQTGEGAIDTDVNAINQASGLDEANLMGQLVGNELTARRQQVVNALNLAQGEEKVQLQAQLAQIDANLRLMGVNNQTSQINNQNSQFYDNMAYGIGQDEANYNQALLRLLAGG